MITWKELLATRDDSLAPDLDHADFGPNTRPVAAAISVLRSSAWFERVGQDVLEQSAAAHVQSWHEVFEIFDDESGRYAVGGHLLAIVERYEDYLNAHPREEEWWAGAVDAALGTIPIPLPSDLGQERRELMFDYCQLYIPKLLGEIIVGDAIDCSYFREQMVWFYLGHLPCGWEGDWPAGRMRVY